MMKLNKNITLNTTQHAKQHPGQHSIKNRRIKNGIAAAVVLAVAGIGAFGIRSDAAQIKDGWTEDGKYWYEGGVRQGYDPEDRSYRGKEIYDADSDAWYWLDAIQYGAKAVNKDVYQESYAGIYADRADGTGKWVRYDENGHMVKGWDTNDYGKYYFDLETGAMVKGTAVIDGVEYCFDSETGVLCDNIFITENGCRYWYENGIRQGLEGRGKEIYDPRTDAWYWLDAVDGGKMAVGKDVYQESSGGKWVRYDENGKMKKGWDTTEVGMYYFDMITGAMTKGTAVIDGITCIFDENTGILLNEDELPYDIPEAKHRHQWAAINGYRQVDEYGDVPVYGVVKRMNGYPFEILACDELGINRDPNQLYLDWHVGENQTYLVSIEYKVRNGELTMDEALVLLNNPSNYPYPETYNYTDPRANTTSQEQIGTEWGVVGSTVERYIDHYECEWYGSDLGLGSDGNHYSCDGYMSVEEWNAKHPQ